MQSLVIGLGEVGKGIFMVLESRTHTIGRDIHPIVITEKIDILHICIPYNDKFEEAVRGYIKLYKPVVTIVYSTVPIGTCDKLKVLHSPVEGRHPNIDISILSMPRWIGGINNTALTIAKKFWEKIVPVRVLPNASFTEWLKLRSTSRYGINLAFADYEARVSKRLGMDYVAVKQFDLDYNMLYENLGLKQFKRYVLDPPEGKIGGHCVVPNAEILDRQYPSPMLKLIKDFK